MAKLPFSKLGVKVETDIAYLPWGDYNIEVNKYLPMGEKTEMVSKIINKSSDNNGYYNPLKVKVYLTAVGNKYECNTILDRFENWFNAKL